MHNGYQIYQIAYSLFSLVHPLQLESISLMKMLLWGQISFKNTTRGGKLHRCLEIAVGILGSLNRSYAAMEVEGEEGIL